MQTGYPGPVDFAEFAGSAISQGPSKCSILIRGFCLFLLDFAVFDMRIMLVR